MPIPFTCPHCGHQTIVDDRYAGQSGPCAQCGQTITIPTGAAGGATATRSSGMGTGAIIAIVAVVILAVLLVCGGVLAALLLPAVSSAREAARRSQCTNNLKQIGLAMHNYHEVYGCLPTSRYEDPSMRSWRTAILPFIEQQPLFDQYASGGWMEPWDSPAHQGVVQAAIAVYRCPSAESLPQNGTSYVMIVGEGTVGEVGAEPSFADITDGLSNTILAVEWPESQIPWAKPEDITVEQFLSLFGQSGSSSSNHPGGVNVLLCDGSVRFMSFTTDRETVRKLLTRAGGEEVFDF